ncbi:MAG: cytochrome c [Pyrinomonadaceae bacterium]|nr:cytochrome c [Pyrinomonadaceae bacterium]MDQ3174663.1 cytochrome c [Acidobacteriota bacterium]
MKFTRQGVAVCSAVALLFAFLLVVSETARATFQRKKGGNFALRSRKVGELYNRNCARCHGAAGRGDTPIGKIFKAPDFTDPEWWAKKKATIAVLSAAVVRGKGNMPAFGKKLKRSEINLLVSRVRSFRK